jgi:uncharacterized protein (TIGR00159 family)
MMLPVHWQSLFDFAVLACAIYVVLAWARQARAVRIALAIIGLHVGAIAARNYDLAITSWVFSAAGFLAIAVLLVIFQPELRYALMRLDTILRSGWRKQAALATTYRAISDAAFDMAEARVGALLVLVRHDAISELMQDGIMLGAQVSRELIAAIFQKTSPLHDGAVVIDGPVITRAEAVLPLTQRPDVPSFFGTRHRAAMGLAERSDAIVIVVSEERGTVTLMQNRKLREMRASDELTKILEQIEAGPQTGWPARLKLAITRNLRLKLAATALAAGVWIVALYTGATIRTVTVPVAFSAVPPGMTITSQSAAGLAVQLRGNSLMMDSAALSGLVAKFSLSGAQPGPRSLAVTANNFDLPPGIRFERASPSTVSVKLVRP